MNHSPYIRKATPRAAGLWSNRPPLLKALAIELTERCNNNCIHCNINLPCDDEADRAREMAADHIKSLLSEAVELGCITVRFTGGEPLLRSDFTDIYLHARRLGLRVELFTNATLIGPGLADIFAEIPPKEKVEISLYGMSAETYEAVTRIQGSFTAAMAGINLLKERDVPFIVKWVCLPQNRDEEVEFTSWTSNMYNADNSPSKIVLLDLRSRRDSEEKNHLIQSLRRSPEEVAKVAAVHGKARVREIEAFSQRNTEPRGASLLTCDAGLQSCAVDAYGDFQLCQSMRHPDTTCRLNQGGLKAALTDFAPRIRAKSAANPDYLNRCARCVIKGFCEQCPARSWMEHGSLDEPVEYLCEVAHASVRQLGLLEKGEKGWEIENWQRRLRSVITGNIL